jgi:hypothetical protein
MMRIRRSEASSAWWPAVAASLLWGLAAASALLWWLHWPRPVGQGATPAVAALNVQSASGLQGTARALGHISPVVTSPDLARRFVLSGVIATGAGRGSVLLGVDGQPPRAFVQGQTVAEGWRLHSVRASGARLSAVSGGGELDLELVPKP